MKSQIRFAKLNSKNEKKKNIPFHDITLSSEMTSWLDQTFSTTDEDGYLPEVVGSALTQPLDSFAAFCPTGNLLKSKFTSTRIPRRENDEKSLTFQSTAGAGAGTVGTVESVDTNNKLEKKVIDFDETVNRLNVMWLQRKAKLEEEDGDLNRSYQTMQEAIDLHVGSQPYEMARMSEPVQSSNPLDLMAEIEKNYFPYDATSHRIADKLQRWYHRFYSKKTTAASIVQRKYRKYLRIRKVWRDLQVQLQCSKLIQRRFRTHLKRMHRLATKLKAWYLMRVKVREFNHLIRFYRSARFIQRILRGMWGRKIAKRKKLEKISSICIQRNIRGYICRYKRSWGLLQYHKIFYYAALKIQCLFRRLLAISRCQRRLLEEIMREEMRMTREKSLRDEIIQLELSRTRIYLNSPAGRLHYESCKKKILAQDEEFNKKKPTLTVQEILTHDAEIIFEIYDGDGSGTIDSKELQLMLIDLCVPLDSHEITSLIHQLDEDGSGDIDFEEFIDWYSNGGGDNTNSMSGIMFKQLLRARRVVLDLSGETLKRRAERTVLRQCCSWLSNETKSMFRMTNGPKYNCCRCLEPFVLFTDYLRHFKGNGDNRICCVTGERSFFYTKFWIQNDWLKQRQCESEVMRVTYEYPCLTYKAMMAVYAELAILSNPELSFLLSGQIMAASERFQDLLQFVENDGTTSGFYTKDLGEYIYEIANLCNDGFLSPNIAHCIAQCLGVDLPNDWVVHDRWRLELFHHWLLNLDILKRPLPPPKISCFKCCHSIQKIREKDSYLLGNIFVRCVRLLLVGAETSLISLAEYRLKRPRRITISDGELKKNKLQLLTRESYDTVRIKLIKRLRVIRDTLRKLQISAINFHKLRENRKFIKSSIRYIRQKLGLSSSQVDVITEDPTEEEIETYEIESAHIRAKAHYQYRSKTRIGKAHLQRVKYELWAKKRAIDEEEAKRRIGSNSNPENNKILTFVDHLMNVFSIPEEHCNEIHFRDLDLLFQNYLHLHIPTTPPTSSSVSASSSPAVSPSVPSPSPSSPPSPSPVLAPSGPSTSPPSAASSPFSQEFQSVLLSLDPHNTGYITKESLSNWLLTNQHQPYVNYFIKLSSICNIATVMGTKDAKLKILCDMRRIIRNEIYSQKQSLRLIDALLEAEENVNLTQKQRKLMTKKMKIFQEESEISNEKLKYLKLLFDKEEQRVLSRISEDDAEKLIQRKLLFTREGRYFLAMEMLFLRIASETISTIGEIIPSTSPLPSSSASSALTSALSLASLPSSSQLLRALHQCLQLNSSSQHEPLLMNPQIEMEQQQALIQCLSILINCFDTDCSGTFDESEITLLLKCVKCSLPEKWILFYFPDVIIDSSSLSQVISHLLTRVHWSRAVWRSNRWNKDLQIATKSYFSSSSLLLISLARQTAREKSYQAAELIQTGILINNENEEKSNEGNDGKRSKSCHEITEGLLIRCQLLAVRQLNEFLNTPFGHIRQLIIQQELLTLWEQVVMEQYSKVSLIQYLFQIFQLDGTGTTTYPFRILNSELPHIIRFATVRFKWNLKIHTCQLLSTLYKFTEPSDARWVMFDELQEIFETVFETHTQQLSKYFHQQHILNDSKRRMESIARQQALLIVINYPDKNVKETNYRCFILGVLRCLEMLRSLDSNTHNSGSDEVNWNNIPFDAMLIYLLAQGFTYSDLIQNKEFYQSDDIINYDHTVDPEEILFKAMNEIFSQLNCLNSLYRIVRYLGGVHHFQFYSKLVKILTLYRNEINSFGRMFLNEITTGVSHCSFDS